MNLSTVALCLGILFTVLLIAFFAFVSTDLRGVIEVLLLPSLAVLTLVCLVGVLIAVS
jgi:hypothetical protein